MGGVSPDDWTYVLHSEEQAELYKAHWPSDVPCNITVSGISTSQGLGGQRWWIDNQIQTGEWYLQMDDNIQRFTRLEGSLGEYNDPEIYKDLYERSELDEMFDHTITSQEFLNEVISELKARCEDQGTVLGGFASTQNSFFRCKKWTRIGFVVGKVLLIRRNDQARFDPTFFTSDDYQFSCEVLLQFGSIVRNNYVYPVFPRYMAGGLGRLPDRQKPYARAAQQLMEKYPGAFNINYGRKDMDPGSAVKFRFNDASHKSLERWRTEMLAKEQ